MSDPRELEQARFLRRWDGFINSRVHKTVGGGVSAADRDELRQEARIAAWQGYLEWLALPDEQREDDVLKMIVARKIKDAVLDAWYRLRQQPRDARQRGSGAAARLFHELLASTPASERGIRARHARFAHTITAYQVLMAGTLHGSTGLVDALTTMVRHEVVDRVAYALARLDEVDRQLLRGLFYDGRSLTNVCAELGIHGRSAQSRRRQLALDMARKYMDDYASALGTHNTGGTLDDDEPGGSFV